MPFTAAHAAAILPLRRCRWLDAPALVLGATAPDWEYFLALRHISVVGHTLPGLFTFCLPVGLVLWVLFEAIVRRPLILLLPAGWRERLWGRRASGWPSLGRIAGVILSIGIGAVTHLAWDSITEPGNWLVQLVPPLGETAIRAGGLEVKGYRVLQHVSTVLGLAVLSVFAWRWYRSQRPGRAPVPSALALWSSRLLLCVGPPVAGAWWAMHRSPAFDGSGRQLVIDGVIATIAFAAAALLGVASVWRGVEILSRGRTVAHSGTILPEPAPRPRG